MDTLLKDTDIKIVTVNGTLVNKGRSTGGSYIWDGNDMNGKRVASGIYMVQTATQTGEKGTVCKIAIIN
jgi:flagellar hook assembly protein FlgD